LSWSEFAARYQATDAAIQAYVAGLPLWVNVWRGWMFLVFGLSIAFVVWRVEARWVALTMVVSTAAYNLVAMFSGVGRFPSIAFLAFWSPLAVYLYRRRGRCGSAGRFERVYATWLRLALGTLAISLAFDTYNVFYSLVQGVP